MGQQDARSLSKKYHSICRFLDERGRRAWAAVEATSLPYGGVSLVARATGLSRSTIHAAIRELQEDPKQSVLTGRIRRTGGGRKPLTQLHPGIMQALAELLEPTPPRQIDSPLSWTCKNTHCLAVELQHRGYRIGERKVAGLLHEMQFRLQPKSRNREGGSHPDSSEQFEYINAQAQEFLHKHWPVIFVDIKKKALAGQCDGEDRMGSETSGLEQRLLLDTCHKDFNRDISNRRSDGARGRGWLNTGIDSNTAEFARDSILSWWKRAGCGPYAQATDLLIVVDAGRGAAKTSLLLMTVAQDLANSTALQVHVSHFPRGASKWNKIEYRMFFFTTHDWAEGPLVRYDTIIHLIGSAQANAGLRNWIEWTPPKRSNLAASACQQLNLRPATFSGNWNYCALPRGM